MLFLNIAAGGGDGALAGGGWNKQNEPTKNMYHTFAQLCPAAGSGLGPGGPQKNKKTKICKNNASETKQILKYANEHTTKKQQQQQQQQQLLKTQNNKM